jgi:predicted nucleic acid-binding protein
MRRILLDTNIYVAFKRSSQAAIEVLQQVDYIGINTIVLGELLSGFTGGTKEPRNRKELEEFLSSPRVELLAIDDGTAEYYAQIFWNLKARGQPIPTNDLWIAASAMNHGLALYTLDAHFQKIDGLLLK